MHRLFLFLFSGIFLALPGRLRAQPEEETVFRHEFLYGVNFNSNSGLIGGLGLKWVEDLGGRHGRMAGLELVNVKHPKEYRTRTGSSTYIQYKTHYLFALRPYYGRRWVIFDRAPEDGVRISLLGGAGPTIGILKPYYVLYREGGNRDVVSVPYTEDLVLNNIDGVGPFYDGFDRIRYRPGVHGRLALSFDFGFLNTAVSGLETGVTFEQFFRKAQIMAVAPNFSSFNAVYFTLWFGRRY